MTRTEALAQLAAAHAAYDADNATYYAAFDALLPISDAHRAGKIPSADFLAARKVRDDALAALEARRLELAAAFEAAEAAGIALDDRGMPIPDAAPRPDLQLQLI